MQKCWLFVVFHYFCSKIIQDHVKHAFRSFSSKLLHNILETRVLSGKNCFSTFLVIFAQNLLEHENKVFSSRKVLFPAKLTKTQKNVAFSYNTLFQRYIQKCWLFVVFHHFYSKMIEYHVKHAFRSFSSKIQNIWENRVFWAKTLFFLRFSPFLRKTC